jgi:hypothetical protein
MPEEIRINRTTNPNPVPVTPTQQVVPATQMNSKTPWIVLVAVVGLIVILGIIFRDRLFGSNEVKKEAPVAKASGYQAMFLTNGQVYFGKLTDPNGVFPTMTDVYYLQVVQPPLQGQQEQVQQQQQGQQPQISLVKLGNELHGPMDEMKINREHILFYENLKEDGQVVQAIKNYKANPQGQGTQPTGK